MTPAEQNAVLVQFSAVETARFKVACAKLAVDGSSLESDGCGAIGSVLDDAFKDLTEAATELRAIATAGLKGPL